MSGSCHAPRPSSSCASTCTRSISTPTARSAIRPASCPPWRRCSADARTRTSRRRTTSATRSGSPRRADALALATGDAAATTAAHPGADAARRHAEIARAYATYQRLLAENGCIDFGDQVALALRLVRESAAARSAIAGRFRYILVDEFQDTNRVQAELVHTLAASHRNVMVVGDDDQAIYAFRGAAIENILGFQERYTGVRTIVLRRNYRSVAPILAAAHRLIRHNDPDRLEVRTGISKRLRAERPTDDPAPVRLEAFATGSDEADWIAADIAARIGDGARPRDHAVLVRANGHADPVIRALNVAAIPWRFSGASGLYARPEVKLLMCFLRVDRRPWIERRCLRTRGLGDLRDGRRGPDGHRQCRPPTKSPAADDAPGDR